MNFASDNTKGASPEILQAILAANEGNASPYGDDALTARVEAAICEIFETDAAVFLVATGTAANSLALSLMTPPYGAVLCHSESHIHVDECGAPEFYSGGAKLITLDGKEGKLHPEALEQAAMDGAGFVHHVQPKAVSLTQVTEAGTTYKIDEVQAISEICKRHSLKLHMDGARFANAVETLGCSPAEMTWKAGVDTLCFGATKNGALAAEAVVLFDRSQADEFAYRRKRGGHLFSKMRFMAAQMEAYLTNDLWRKNAAHANAMAERLARQLTALQGISLQHPQESNLIFVKMPLTVIEGLWAEGFEFHQWGAETVARLVTAFNTTEAEVDGLIDATIRLLK